MSESVTSTPASIELSERQLEAFETVANAMESAECAIDGQFCPGFAEAHPVLIAGYLQAVAITYLADAIGARLHKVLCALEGTKPTTAEVHHG
jgi:hypothetical protein